MRVSKGCPVAEAVRTIGMAQVAYPGWHVENGSGKTRHVKQRTELTGLPCGHRRVVAVLDITRPAHVGSAANSARIGQSGCTKQHGIIGMISFGGAQFPKSGILHAVFFYLRCRVSYRELEEILTERGVTDDHATLNLWVVKHATLAA